MATENNREIISKDAEAMQLLILVAKEVFSKPETRVLERTLRYFGVSLANSSVAVATLCADGYGVDALKIARGMFETYITFRYLRLRPNELSNFLSFDAVARHKRLQFYKAKFPRMYSMFSLEHINNVENNYHGAKKIFLTQNGKIRDRWCRHDLAQMARIVGCTDLYELFYRHVSSILHIDPMGLAMLIDGTTMEVLPGPTTRHIGLPMRVATMIFRGALSDYSKLIGADHAEVLKRVDGLIGVPIELEGSFLGSLSDAFKVANP